MTTCTYPRYKCRNQATTLVKHTLYGDLSLCEIHTKQFLTRTITLSGSSRDRRKFLRKIQRDYKDCLIAIRPPDYTLSYKTLNGKQVQVQDANTLQNKVVITLLTSPINEKTL